jgi:hypothetical protein
VDEIRDAFQSQKAPVIAGQLMQQFLKTIRNDDIESLETLFMSLPEDKRRDFQLLTLDNNPLPQFGNVGFNSEILRDCCCQFPFAYAAMFNAASIVKFYCEKFPDAVLRAADVGQANVIFALILGSYLQIHEENTYIKLYQGILEHFPGVDDRRCLLHAQTRDGLRPVELASKLGQYGLLSAIFETGGVYKINEEQKGPFREIWYNVEDYHIEGTRSHLSPMKDLLSITDKDCETIYKRGFLELPFMKAWVNETYSRNYLMIIAWAIYRLVFMILTTVISEQGEHMFIYMDILIRIHTYGNAALGLPEDYDFAINGTAVLQELAKDDSPLHNGTKDILICQSRKLRGTPLFGNTSNVWSLSGGASSDIVLVLCLATLVFDFCEVVMTCRRLFMDRHQNRKFARNGSYVISNVFFRISTNMMAAGYWLFFGLGTAIIQGQFDQSTQIMMELAVNFAILGYGIAKVLTVWSLLYFMQVSSALGSFVIGFQRMMIALSQFLCIFMIIFFSFAHTFTDILKIDCTHTGFEGQFKGMYYTFLMMLNIINPTNYDVMTSNLTWILHVAFIITVTILLVNFLIALMSNKHTEMTQYGDLIFRLYRLDMAMTVERRLAKLRFTRRCRNPCKKQGVVVVTTVQS